MMAPSTLWPIVFPFCTQVLGSQSVAKSPSVPVQPSSWHKLTGSLWYGLNCVPPTNERYIEVQSPNTLGCDFIWKWGFHRSSYIKMKPLGWVLIHYNQCPSKKGKLDPERKPHEGEGRDQGDAPTSQAISKIDGDHQPPGERHGTDSHSQPSKQTNAAGRLDLRLPASRTMRE